MYRHSNQCGQIDDVNQIALKNFREAYSYLLAQKINKVQEEQQAFQNLLTYHQSNQAVKNDQLYVRLWLNMAKKIKDPEEVYVYMHVSNIGQGNSHFYKDWIQMYQKRRQYILAYQLLQQTKNFFTQQFYNKTISEMTQHIEKRIAKKYLKQTIDFVHASQDYSGIGYKEFQILNEITIEKRIHKVEARIFGIQNGTTNSNFDNYDRYRRQSDISQDFQERKRYSDLINMKNVSGSNKNGIYFYIEEQYRENFVPQIELLVYEISYYEKKYYNINPSGSKNFLNEKGFEFWLKQPKIQLYENESDISNFLRISNAVPREKKISSRLQQIHHYSPKPTKKRSSFFECKRNQKKKFQFQKTKSNKMEIEQISTCENLNSLNTEQQFGVFEYNHLFDESNSSLNCQQRLGRPDHKLIKDNIISELPRHNRNSFFDYQLIQIKLI